MRILAEDDMVSRRLLESTLRRFGHEVIAVGNGRDAWAAFEKEAADLVISDWMMPEIDGPSLCRMVRAAPVPRYVYFILLTSLKGKGRYLEGIEAGADDFISKPFDSDELEARLRVADRILKLASPTVSAADAAWDVCSRCDRIERPDGTWMTLEAYLAERTRSSSNRVCPVCTRNCT